MSNSGSASISPSASESLSPSPEPITDDEYFQQIRTAGFRCDNGNFVINKTITVAQLTGFLNATNGLFGIAEEVTGVNSASLGTNCPANTLTPYKWIKTNTSDGETVYYPVWK